MKRLAWRACWALVCGLLLAATIARRPEWFLPPRLLALAVKTLGKDFHPSWKSFELRLASQGFARKRLLLHADDFCFSVSSGDTRGCFNRIDADLAVELSPRGVFLTRLARFDVDGRFLSVDAAHRAPPQKKKKKPNGLANFQEALPASLRRLRIEGMNIKLPETTLALPSTKTFTGDLSLTYSTAQAPPLALTARLYYDAPGKSENLDATLSIDSDFFTQGTLTTLTAIGKITGDAGDSAAFKARLDQKIQGAASLDASAWLVSGARRLRARATGVQSPNGYSARLTAAASDPVGALRALSVDDCSLEAPLNAARQAQALRLSCLLSAESKPFGAPLGSKKIDLAIRLEATKKPKTLQPDYFEGSLTAKIAPRKDWYKFRADAAAEFAGRLGDLPRSLKSRHRIDAALDIANFADLVKFLHGTAYAIPAPFHVLQGPMNFSLNSRGNTREPDQKLVYGLNSNLTSGRQKLVATLDGTLLAKQAFTPTRAFTNRTEVVLQNVVLELPYIKIGAVPAVTVDSRIRTGEEETAARAPKRAGQPLPTAVARSTASAVDYKISVKTASPILLYANINPAPAPIALDLTASPQKGLGGQIKIQRFEAELFKRKGVVDHVTLSLREGAKPLDLDGLITFRHNEADIRVKLLGSTDKPHVVFDSDPPMRQQDIIALLLFGKSPDELDPDQTATVSNSHSAMASGAFGLASLYLFASTPIQYVGYDPSSQSYAIKFSLPGGASLEVGSTPDQSRRLTLRKRLARHWVLQTEVQSIQEGQTSSQRNAVTTFIEWFQRY